jgi:hypothetical protein
MIDVIRAHEAVERVSPWRDRVYVTLRASRGSRYGADGSTKLWLRGDVLTIETGKGYHSDAFVAAKHAVMAAVVAAGGSVREG